MHWTPTGFITKDSDDDDDDDDDDDVHKQQSFSHDKLTVLPSNTS